MFKVNDEETRTKSLVLVLFFFLFLWLLTGSMYLLVGIRVPNKLWQCRYSGSQLFYRNVAQKFLGNPHENLFDGDTSVKLLFACNNNTHWKATHSKNISIYAKSMNIKVLCEIVQIRSFFLVRNFPHSDWVRRFKE